MFNFEGRQNLGWLAARCCPPAPRGIMLLVFAALLALAVPAAHAAGCTGFEYFPNWDDCTAPGGGCWAFPDPFYVMVPASNFLTGYHTIYEDEQCQDLVPPEKDDGYDGSDYHFGSSASEVVGVAFGRSGRKAMEFCELNTDLEIAYVSKLDYDLTSYYCNAGKRMGPERQRRESLFGMWFKGNAKQALKECRRLAKSKPNHYPRRPNLVEKDPPGGSDHWICWRTWEVKDAYLKRVGA